MECSSRVQLNVAEVIFFALKAVCYPLAPLYDSREHVGHFLFKRGSVERANGLDPNRL